MSKMVRFVGVALVGASLFAFAPVAQASRADVVRRGDCSVGSTWKMKAKPDNGRIELAFEVDQNVVGQTWHVRIQRNGTQIFSGNRTTQSPSGSFELNRRVADPAGSDRFVARASNASSGETCVGEVTL